MEEDQQSATPVPPHQERLLPRAAGMSHSSSAPDLRLMLATELPDSKPMYLPVLGSYAGALVPYTSPEVPSDYPCFSFIPAMSRLVRLVSVIVTAG